MKPIFLRSACAAAILSVAVEAQFVHPGLINTQLELDAIKKDVAGNRDAARTAGWNALKRSSLSSLSYAAHPYAVVHVSGSAGNSEEKALRDDALSAYSHALQWVATGDAAHAKKAIEIMRAWSSTLKDIVPATANDPQVQDDLESDWDSPMWISAAEIIRNYAGGAAGWSTEDRAQFAKMTALFRTKAKEWDGSKLCCPNQPISAVNARLALAVFEDDKALFDSALSFYRSNVLARAIGPSGEVLEINRASGGDCAHAVFNIEGIFDIAEIAWHQGVDLYSDPRLPKGLEYMAQLLTTGAQTTSEGKVTCSNDINSVEIAYNHYHNRVSGGPSLPHTEALLKKIRPTAMGSGRFIPWDTFTHADLSSATSAIPAAERSARPLASAATSPRRYLLRYAMGKPGRAEITLYSRDGRAVARLGGTRGAGPQEEAWDARGTAAGVYIARLRAEGVDAAVRIVIGD